MKAKITPDAAEAVSTSTALAAPAPAALANYNPDQYDDVSRDIEVPVLGLVNNVGPLAKQHKNKGGNFVLGDLLIGTSVQVVPIEVAKYFRETWRNGVEIKYGSPLDKERKIFGSAHDAAKAGYIVDFSGSATNRVEEGAKIGYLVLQPAGDQSGEFVYKAGSLLFAKARCSYTRNGFREVFRRVFDHANKLALVKGIETKGLNHSTLFNAAKPWTHLWTLTSVTASKGDNEWWEPRIAKGEPLPADVIERITADYGA
jgi:hypothetical protein